MGIQNLKQILCDLNFLEEQKNISIENTNIFIDFSSLIYKFLFTSQNINELVRKITSWFYYKNKTNNVCYIFVDRGFIKNKLNERLIRKISQKSYIEGRKKMFTDFINKLNDKTKYINDNSIRLNLLKLIPNNNSNHISDKKAINIYRNTQSIINSDIIQYNQLDCYEVEKYKKQEFILFNKLYGTIDIYTNILIKQLIKKKYIIPKNIIYCDNIDAEFIIARKTLDIYNKKIKPVFYSDDQDLLLLLLRTRFSKILISFGGKFYVLKNNNVSKNIALLTILFNKSDYFKGINGFQITSKKFNNILFEKLNVNENDFKSYLEFIVYMISIIIPKNSSKKNIEKISDDRLREFKSLIYKIKDYSYVNEDFYTNSLEDYRFDIKFIKSLIYNNQLKDKLLDS